MVNPINVIQDIIEAEGKIGSYVVSPGGNPFERWYKDGFKDRCDEYANLPPWARALSGPAGGSLSRICKPHWDEQGTDGPVNPGPLFNGGQCFGVTYNVTYAFTNSAGALIQQTTTSFIGPVTGVVGGPTNQFGGVPVLVRSSNPAQADRQVGTTTVANKETIRLVSVARTNGAPDTCGDPPDQPLIPGPNPPPNPGPQPGPEPRNNPDGGPIPEVPIPPYDDPTYGPQPFVPGEEPGGGGEPAPPQSPAGGDGLPGAPDSVAPPVGQTGNDGEGENFPFGPPPAGKIWVGALVENTVDPRYGNIPGTGPANTVYPYVIGNASLIYAGGFSSSSRMRSRWHEMFRPVTALEVTGARVQCRPGVSASIRPVSATICPENTCET